MKMKQTVDRQRPRHAAKGKRMSGVRSSNFHADTTPTHTVLLMSLNQ